MNKEIIVAVGSTSWWKNRKLRSEAAQKLKLLKREWKLKKIESLRMHEDSIDTKIYKKYYLYR
ncbi:MAG: hypothetical protein ACJ0G4_01145 [Alphaproteobacteria bacterium]|tara:strand:+ start:1028 stop:1216 length:189 start_codon:yes stop_codon:yes gene_type:complete